MFHIRLATSVQGELEAIPRFYRAKVLDAIAQQLTNQPTLPTRMRKILVDLEPPFEAEPPIWQLRVGDYRIFYDVNDEECTVYVRAIRHKPPGRTTEEIL